MIFVKSLASQLLLLCKSSKLRGSEAKVVTLYTIYIIYIFLYRKDILLPCCLAKGS